MIALNPHNPNGTAIRLAIVAYYRNSGAVNETSIGQQQQEVRRYAEQRGWKILAEYIDTNKSGSKDEAKRTGLTRMLAAAQRGEFNAVLVWDSSRFGRLDSIDVAESVKILRAAGVHLESVREGSIDWTTSMGRLQFAMLSESNNDYSHKISGNTVRGRNATIEAGYWPHGQAPFGFDRQYIENGNVVMVVARARKLHKAKTWKLKLVPNEIEAPIVKWIFDEFDTRDTSMRWLVADLNTRDVIGPNGTKQWSRSHLRQILANPAYAGDCSVGRTKRAYKAFAKITKQTRMNACPAIVARDVFNRVQTKLVGLKEKSKREYAPRAKTSPLNGILICGHCGYRMTKKTIKTGVVFYCSSSFQRPACGCHQWRIYEHEVLPDIRRLLREAIDTEVIERLRARPVKAATGEVERLNREAEKLRKQIARGEENFLMADASLVPQLQARLLEWKNELAQKENTIRLIEHPEDAKSTSNELASWWDTVKDSLVTVREGVPLVLPGKTIGKKRGFTVSASQLMGVCAVRTEADKLRELLNRIKCTVTVTWRPNGKRFFSLDRAVLKAEIHSEIYSSTHEHYTGGTSANAARGVLADENQTGAKSSIAAHVILVERVIKFDNHNPFSRFQTLRDPVTGAFKGRVPLKPA